MTRLHPQKFQTSDGLTLVGDIGGPVNAPLVVLLHGGGQTRHSWSGAARTLVGSGYQIINLDARGHGDSDWSPQRAYDADDRIKDIQAVVEGVEVPFVLVGASMGGLSSIHAVANGLSPEGIVLVDIVPDMEMTGVERIVGFMNANHGGFATLDEAADAVAAYYPERPRPKDPSGLMKNLRQHDDGRLYWHWDPAMFNIEDSGPSPEPLHHSARKLGGRPEVAVLVVRGLLSDMVSDEGIAKLKTTVPHTEAVNIGGAGHMVAGDKNDAFNDAVGRFLGENLPLTRSQ